MAKTQNVYTTKSSITDLFMDIPEKKHANVTSEYHLLVIACGAYRLANQENPLIYSIEAFPTKKIQPVDFELADQVKDYYSKKLTWLKIKGKTLTKFRKDLSTFLYTSFDDETGRYTTPDYYSGMAYRLPYFYVYDTELDKIFSDKIPYDFLPFVGSKVLHFIKRLPRHSQRTAFFDYFFVDEHNFKYCISLMKDNPCISLYENIVNKYPIVVTGKFKPVKQDHNYYSLEKYVMDIKHM